MSVTKEFTKLAIEEETVEGVYEAPDGNTSFIETTEAGASIEGTREKKERNVMTGDRITRNFRSSKRDVSVSIETECKSGSAPGEKPEYSLLLESAGFRADLLASRKVSGVSNTTSLINIANTSGLKVGDIVLVKESSKSVNSDHVSPILSLVDDVSITLLVPAPVAFSDNVEIEKSVVYELDKNINKTVSITKIYEGDEVEMRASGCRTTSISLNNFTTGEYPNFSFSLDGLNFEEVLNSSAHVPSYDTSSPPLILGACIYKNNTKLVLNELTLSIENTLAKKMSTCAPNGNISSRGVGKYLVSGSINPYKKIDAIDFKLDEEEFSLFGYAYNPTENDGEMTQVFAFYIPKVKLVSKTDSDLEGILTDSLSWEAVGSDSIKIALI